MKKSLIITLVIIAITIGAVFAQQMKMKAEPAKMMVEHGIREKLQLTDDQITKLDEIQKKYQKKMIKLRADLKLAHLELRDLMDSEASQKDIQKALNKVNNLRAKILELHVNRELEIGKILTPEQKKLLKEKPIHHLLRGYVPHHMMREKPEIMKHHREMLGAGFCHDEPCPCIIEKEIEIMKHDE